MAGEQALSRRYNGVSVCDEFWRALRDDVLGTVKVFGGGAPYETASSLARSVALDRAADLPSLLQGLHDGCDALAAGLDEQEQARLAGIRAELIEAVASGYVQGLTEQRDELARRVTALEPEAGGGPLSAEQTVARLSMELQRCERMQLPLGLIGLPGPASHSDAGRLVRETLRQYDVVGRLQAGNLIACLPDVSRAGLLAAAERLNERLHRPGSPCAGTDVCLALLHLDGADLEVSEMLRMVGDVLAASARAEDYICWG